MLNHKTQVFFGEYLLDISKLEKEVNIIKKKKRNNFYLKNYYLLLKLEILKQKLFNIKNFDPFISFSRISKNRKGFIEIKDLNDFFISNKISVNEKNIKILFFHQNSSILNYKE